VSRIIAGDILARLIHGVRGQIDAEGGEAIGKGFYLDIHGKGEVINGIWAA
jgi:hypothetical protein